MRFGAPLFGGWKSPEGWVGLLQAKGFDAAYCPVGLDATVDEIREYRQAAAENGIVISEVGAWENNPLHPDREMAESGYRGLVRSLLLAEAIGARCCVNVAGSRGELWYGHHLLNLTQETFESIVAYVKRLLGEVNPVNTFFCLEMSPWMFPTTSGETLSLIQAVGLPGFAVHLDIVNITMSPRLYYENADTTHDCFNKLGPLVRSIHAKDITLEADLLVHLNEIRPGLGGFDYRALLKNVQEFSPDAPLMLEHLANEAEYDKAADYVRSVAASLNISMPLPEGAC
jgi:sugar phosphate isomerase/epimerase